ncbi:ATPase [Proteinivorax hydrogeniformans]|uniref:ATPase n=1 Tax=Proteinivorax hydrogeniformans TaxID=1826727 RepID=A0AAU8HPA4_9FIRM
MEESIKILKSLLNKANTKIAILDGEKSQLTRQKKSIEQKVNNLKDEMDVYSQVRVLLNKSADHGRTQAKEQIEILVTNALQFIFDESYSFKIEFKEVRNRVEAHFFVCSTYNGKEVKTNPEDSRGGGVVDIVSLALRIALLQTYRPMLKGPLVLDEPAKHVSEDYVDKVVEFLNHISSGFNRQIILITHNPYIMEASDKSFQVELKNGISSVREGNLLDTICKKI